jgi:hypothetical protein
MSANILVTVTAASDREAKAKRDLDAAILQAHAEGISNRAIAAACHLSHERVRQIVNAAKPAVDEARIEARLAELDARWDRFIDVLKDRYMPVESVRRSEQAFRNRENGRAKRQSSGTTRAGVASGASAWKSTVRPTVTVEARRFAETFALGYLEENGAHPVCVKVLGELDEAAALREQLAAVVDARVSFLHD